MSWLRYFFIYLVLLCYTFVFGQIRIVSWNIQNFGKSKTPEQIEEIAELLRDFDIIAIQEVVAGEGGSQAVAQLAQLLNIKGAAWDYRVSNQTDSSPYRTEKYAYLWKKHRVKAIGKGFLDSYYKDLIDREPYIQSFEYQSNRFTLANIHAVPKGKSPERELKFLRYFPDKYATYPLIFLGDFNVVSHHTVFNPLIKQGYYLSHIQQKTTLKKKCKGENCLSKDYDRFIIPSSIRLRAEGILPFHLNRNDDSKEKTLSDHLPIWVELELE